MRAAVAFAAGGFVLGAALLLHDRAAAQRIDPRRPPVLVVGAPAGAAPMQRVDARRSGVSSAPLPSGPLRVAWTKATAMTLEQPALAGADGLLAIVSARGDVLFLDAAGQQRAVVSAGSGQVGPAVLTSAGTVVFTTNRGEVVGVEPAGVRFVARIGGGPNVLAAPLALDDGGAVLATMAELVMIDGEGNVRWRTRLPEPPAAPLVAWRDQIVAVTTSGAVFGWKPGREPARLGSFGASVDGAAALEGDSLLAVVDDRQLAELDLVRGERRTRSVSPGLYLGPPSVRTADGSSIATVMALTHTRGFVTSVGPTGQEQLLAPVTTFTPRVLPDGGAPPLVAPPHTGTLVDARGAVAFAATDGTLGVVSPAGVVDLLGEAPCAAGTRFDPVGLTPLASGRFVVTCETGIVALVEGAAGGAPAGPARP